MTTAQLRALFLFLIIVAAGLVLLGALAKIQHWSIANGLLITGMIAEVICAVGLGAVSAFGKKDK